MVQDNDDIVCALLDDLKVMRTLFKPMGYDTDTICGQMLIVGICVWGHDFCLLPTSQHGGLGPCIKGTVGWFAFCPTSQHDRFGPCMRVAAVGWFAFCLQVNTVDLGHA